MSAFIPSDYLQKDYQGLHGHDPAKLRQEFLAGVSKSLREIEKLARIVYPHPDPMPSKSKGL